MEYTKLTNTELEISRIGIGCWAIGGHGWGYVDDNESIKAIHAALDSGVNFFDTADVYGLGHSERILSKALGNHRSNVVISTKFGLEWDESGNIQNNTTPERVVEAVENSLRRLNIESIPLYLIHHFDGVTPIERTMEALIECKKAGKIQNIGCSNLSMEMVDEANRLIPLSAVQIPYNVIDRGVEEDILPFLKELNISSLAFSSLAHGLLSGKYASKVEFSHDDIRSRSPYFQDQQYKLGSVCNPDAGIRRQAIDHMLECVGIMNATGSTDLSLWFADGTNFPGQANFRQRKQWMYTALQEVYQALSPDQRMLIEYKFFEPAFYHTDLADWGTAYLIASKLGEQAQVLIDLGHHPQGTNIEFIVSYLIDEGKLGGFHFNCRKYADDDLTVGSVNPQELFLIYHELVTAELDPNTETDIAYMIDQSHNLKPKVEASIQSVCNLQTAYARALIVDRDQLAEAQTEGQIIDAERVLQRAAETDVRPLLEQIRVEMNRDPDPLTAYRKSGYYKRICQTRVGGGGQGWAKPSLACSYLLSCKVQSS